MSDPLTIIHGDALSSLRAMESESVQCVVTSPPYFGLRDYGVAPIVWDNHNGCEHEWQEHLQPSANGQTTHAMIAETLNESSATRKPKLSDFCKCGAWRGCFGLEPSPELYEQHLVQIFAEVWRVLREDGTVWINLGDSYAGSNQGRGCKELWPKQKSNRGTQWMTGKDIPRLPNGTKPKDLIGVPWMVAFALRADGWYLRSDIIWSKPNPMPESVTDRPTKSHEYIFLLSKSQKYFFDADAVREPVLHPAMLHRSERKSTDAEDAYFGNAPTNLGRCGTDPSGRNIRSVWTITTQPFSGAHFAPFPPELIKPCILAGAPIGGVVLDPFAGSGTTGKVAIELGRQAILIEPKAEYVEMIKKRCQTTIGLPLAI